MVDKWLHMIHERLSVHLTFFCLPLSLCKSEAEGLSAMLSKLRFIRNQGWVNQVEIRLSNLHAISLVSTLSFKETSLKYVLAPRLTMPLPNNQNSDKLVSSKPIAEEGHLVHN